MRSLTVRARVTLVAAGVLAVGLLAVSVGINVLLRDRLSSDASSVLRDRAAAQLATLDVGPKGIVLEDGPGDAGLDQHSWVFDRGRLVERANAAARVQSIVGELAAVDRPTERQVGEDTRLLAEPIRAPDGARAGTLVVGVALKPYEEAEQIALIGTLVLTGVLLIFAAFAVHRAVGAALEPVATMTAHAAEWGARDLHRRFDVGPQRDELATLAATFNGLLGRIEGVLRHEQRLTNEMAHELRTPLAGLRTEAELALRSGGGDPVLRHGLERVVAGCHRLTRVIETLLRSAREQTPAERCDVATALANAAHGMQAAATSGHVELALTPASAQVEAPSDVVEQALSPLLENAVRHAHARVDVGAERIGSDVVVTVVDDGPGIDGDADSLFAAGVSTTGGAGLGLPLARRLARACGGEVVAVSGEHGHFELRLPAAD